MATVVVLGSGIMATALATPLADNGHDVRLVGTHLDRDIIDSIQATGVHPMLGLQVPSGTTAFQLEDAATAFDRVDLVMSGVNCFGVHWAGQQLTNLLRPGMHIIALAKGMEAVSRSALQRRTATHSALGSRRCPWRWARCPSSGAVLSRHDLATCRKMLEAVLSSTDPDPARQRVVELQDPEVADVLI